jgi:hypothetical protein
MILPLSNFAGVAPMLAPQMLAPNQAQIASNVHLWTGGIDAIYEPSLVTSVTKDGIKQSIYKFGQTSGSDAEWWMTWTTPVNVVRGMVFGDTEEKTYWTGDGYPKASSSAMILQGAANNYPVAHYKLGVPAPTTAPTATLATAAEATTAPADRIYVCTYVTGWGENGSPSGVSNTISTRAGDTVTVSLPGAVTGPYNIVSQRIYRTQTGNTSGTTYYFVAEVPVAQTSFTDSVADENLGEPLDTITFLPPPVDLAGLVGLPGGVMAGFVGRDVYLCEPYKPYAWPMQYVQTVDYPVVALAALGQNLLVLTTGAPYIITVGDPANSTMQKLDINQACVSSRSVAQFGNGVIYASPDGLVYVGLDGSNILTEKWFTRKQWQAYTPTSIHGVQHDGRYYAFWKVDDTLKGGFILDPATQNGVFTTTTFYADASYSDLVQDALFFSVGNAIYKWEGTTTKRPFTWRSKMFLLAKPTSFSAAQIVAMDYTDLTANFYADGVLLHTESVSGIAPFRLPAGSLYYKFEVELSGTSSVASAAVAETLTELGNV